ncbi:MULTISPECIES: PIN domain-containing protein [Bacillus cereus group]|uniref:PIN domain-containing protein n=1 Tax=Bacillus cereus group TaxID=86661 RepID=UPI0011458CB3|nr:MULTISPECIES: PIN domain-containing protein [Bacillus cereus group]QFQ28491.1 hypothetical protein DDE73_27700 [Bacillus thuringiensis]
MTPLYIFLDTNILKDHNTSLTKFEFNKTYYVLKKYIVENKVENVKVIVPQIVIEELITQYIAKYKETVKKIHQEIENIQDISDKIDWKIEINKNFTKDFKEYVEFIKSEVDKFLEEEKDFLEIVSFPKNEKLGKIIKRSIRKRKPFFGGKHNRKEFSDAGFKDVIFLESIVEYFEQNNGEYIIVTKDDYFKEINLDMEIVGMNGSLVDKDTGKEIVNILVERFGIEDLSEYMIFARNGYYISGIETALGCKVLGEPLSISRYEVEGEEVSYIEIYNLVERDDENITIITRISDEREFVEILNEDKEVMYEW